MDGFIWPNTRVRSEDFGQEHLDTLLDVYAEVVVGDRVGLDEIKRGLSNGGYQVSAEDFSVRITSYPLDKTEYIHSHLEVEDLGRNIGIVRHYNRRIWELLGPPEYSGDTT